MKKFKYSFILVFILLFNIKDLTYAQGDIGVGNLRNFYTKHDYIDLKGVTDKKPTYCKSTRIFNRYQ